MRAARTWRTAFATCLLLMGAPGGAQVRTVDPNDAIDRDLAPGQGTAPAPALAEPVPGDPLPADPMPTTAPVAGSPARATSTASGPPAVPVDTTYDRDDVLGAAERTFGKGAAGLAEIVEKTLKEQGRPNAYIAGSEGAGAVVVGLRYGSGTMSHKVEGESRVHWTGPSVGFDLGGDATKVFTLVYNLYDTDDLFTRFPAAEGRLYFIGGFAATYLRRGNIVLIPIRLGVGYRAGVNVGYMKFSRKGNWFPF